MNRLVNATLSKRFGAFLLDIFTIILLFSLLYSGFAQIFIRTKAFKEATEKMNEILVDSNLYVYDEEDHNLVHVVKEEDYDVAIEKYYVDYLNDKEAYDLLMEESNLFNNVDGDYIKKESVMDNEVLNFYKEVIGNAIINIKQNDEYKFCYAVNMNYVFYNLFLSFILSFMLFIGLIPCIMKRRTTIGQRVMNLAVVNMENDKFITKTQSLFKCFIILIVEVGLSFVAFGVPFIVSLLFIIFRKDNCSYHDLLSYSKVIDYHYIELDDEKKK